VGQFQVVATSVAAPNKSSTATVNVRTKTKDKEKEKEAIDKLAILPETKLIVSENLNKVQDITGPVAMQRPGDDPLVVARAAAAANESGETDGSPQSVPAVGRAFIQAEERPFVGRDLLQANG
jgi:hypothetical protein